MCRWQIPQPRIKEIWSMWFIKTWKFGIFRYMPSSFHAFLRNYTDQTAVRNVYLHYCVLDEKKGIFPFDVLQCMLVNYVVKFHLKDLRNIPARTVCLSLVTTFKTSTPYLSWLASCKQPMYRSRFLMYWCNSVFMGAIFVQMMCICVFARCIFLCTTLNPAN